MTESQTAMTNQTRIRKSVVSEGVCVIMGGGGEVYRCWEGQGMVLNGRNGVCDFNVKINVMSRVPGDF